MADSFWQSIDLEHIGIMGHSFGGTTSIVASSRDMRLDGCINLDGWLVPVESSIIQSGMNIPFLYIGRTQWETELNYLKLDSLISASLAPSEKLILPGTKHFDYSDTPQFNSLARKVGVAGTMPSDALRDTLNTRILILPTRSTAYPEDLTCSKALKNMLVVPTTPLTMVGRYAQAFQIRHRPPRSPRVDSTFADGPGGLPATTATLMEGPVFPVQL